MEGPKRKLMAAAAGLTANAQGRPSQPRRVLVGSSPGGGTDAMARATDIVRKRGIKLE